MASKQGGLPGARSCERAPKATRLRLAVHPGVLGWLAAFSILATTGCPHAGSGVTKPGTTTQQTSSPDPTPIAPPATPPLLPSAANGATMQITVTDATGTVPGAQVAAFGPTLAQAITDSNGQVALGSLPIGSYTVRVDAAGHQGCTRTFTVSAARQSLTLAIPVVAVSQPLTGTVEDTSGHPLAGARLALGDAWAMSGTDGTYQLAVASPGAVTVKKTGYAVATTTGGVVQLTAQQPRVAFEDSPFAGTEGAPSAAFGSLQSALQAAGFAVENQDDPTADVRVWAAPADLGSINPADVVSYVQAGGKIVVMGDWGGATSYRPDLADALLLPLGVGIENDLVRVDTGNLGRPEWFSPIVGAGPASAGVHSIAVYGAASVQSATPMQVVAGIPSGGYRVQAVDASAVGIVRQVGTGLVVALGDTDAWTNDASDDVAQYDNLKFATNLIAW